LIGRETLSANQKGVFSVTLSRPIKKGSSALHVRNSETGFKDYAGHHIYAYLNVVFSRAENGTAERASPTVSWQILRKGLVLSVMLILCQK